MVAAAPHPKDSLEQPLESWSAAIGATAQRIFGVELRLASVKKLPDALEVAVHIESAKSVRQNSAVQKVTQCTACFLKEVREDTMETYATAAPLSPPGQ